MGVIGVGLYVVSDFERFEPTEDIFFTALDAARFFDLSTKSLKPSFIASIVADKSAALGFLP